VASAKAFLERAGFRPGAIDLAVEQLDRLVDDESGDIDLVAISVPMHTALPIGVRAAKRLRRSLPDAHICFFGLYATLNADYLLDGLADSVIGGEFEAPLVRLAEALAGGRSPHEADGLWLPGRPATPHLQKMDFAAPSRSGLPSFDRYAQLEINGELRPSAAIEASRGCLHLCRHCPIPPVYQGRFFVVPREVVLEDVRRLAAAGARHLTFADPDFFNGPGHTMATVRELHEEFPKLTFDITTKVENILRHRERIPELKSSGCVFVVSAVESLSDEVLTHLAKGHTRQDVFDAQRIVSGAGLALRPSLVPFTPWATLEDYGELLDWIERDALVNHVDPVQLSIRLLVPSGSLLAESDAMRPHLGELIPERFGHAWRHPDSRMDRLQREVAEIVAEAARAGQEASTTYDSIRDAARASDGRAPAPTRFLPARATTRPPRLTEPWFC
jgi:radical SAM superfamily enzyme YgiQ (UPF0313 family)